MKRLLPILAAGLLLSGCRGFAIRVGATIKPPGISVAIVPTETAVEQKARQIGEMILAADAGHEAAEPPLPVK